MNDAATFYAGIVCGLPIGALVLAAIVAGLAELRKQRVGRAIGEQYRADVTRERTDRFIRAIQGSVR